MIIDQSVIENLTQEKPKLFGLLKSITCTITEQNGQFKKTDIDEVFVRLFYISKKCMISIYSNASNSYDIYSVGSSARLMIECLVDALYLIKNPSEASKYWNNQELILEEMNNLDWNLFRSGKIKRLGALDQPTGWRIKNTIADTLIGEYNLLCFFSHPNLATVTWIHDNDSYNAFANYIVWIATDAFYEYMKTFDEYTQFEIDPKYITAIGKLYTDIKE